MQNDVPFGGKIVIFGGDFRQILHIVPHGNRATIIEAIAKNAECWQHVRKYELRTNIRALRDSRFSEWILSVGNGTAVEMMVDEVPKIPIPDHF